MTARPSWSLPLNKEILLKTWIISSLKDRGQSRETTFRKLVRKWKLSQPASKSVGWSVSQSVLVSGRIFSRQMKYGKVHFIYMDGSVHHESIFNNCLTSCDLFSLLYFCRQLYVFRVLTPIISSWYSCNYSFWYWLTGSTAIRCHCCVGSNSTMRADGSRSG